MPQFLLSLDKRSERLEQRLRARLRDFHEGITGTGTGAASMLSKAPWERRADAGGEGSRGGASANGAGAGAGAGAGDGSAMARDASEMGAIGWRPTSPSRPVTRSLIPPSREG